MRNKLIKLAHDSGLFEKTSSRWRAMLGGGALSEAALDWFKTQGLHGTAASAAKEIAGIERGNAGIASRYNVLNAAGGMPTGVARVGEEQLNGMPVTARALFTRAQNAATKPTYLSRVRSLISPENAAVPQNVLMRGAPMDTAHALLRNGGDAQSARATRAVITRHELDEARHLSKFDASNPGVPPTVSWSSHMSPQVIQNEARHTNLIGDNAWTQTANNMRNNSGEAAALGTQGLNYKTLPGNSKQQAAENVQKAWKQLPPGSKIGQGMSIPDAPVSPASWEEIMQQHNAAKIPLTTPEATRLKRIKSTLNTPGYNDPTNHKWWHKFTQPQQGVL